MSKSKPIKNYRESRIFVRVLKKPILGGEYTGKRAKDVEP